ncbi:unnamed protein product [Dicrocoelium dendriticum]|nr:unnamed protein product [Dicrocoelium dendriticum]
MIYSRILSEFFALWGTRFYIVKSDVDGNMKKVSNAVASLNVTSLKEMLAAEQALNQSTEDSSGSVGLLWLKRTYEFLVCALWYLSQSDSNESMKTILLKAYEETLKRYHNRIMYHAFRVSILHRFNLDL